MKLTKRVLLVFLIFFQCVLFSEILLYFLIDKEKYQNEFNIESIFYKYRRSWYGDSYAENQCSISEELIPHPHLAFISKPTRFCQIPITDSGTHGKRNLRQSPNNDQDFRILLIGGSFASHFGILEEKNPIEIELNKRFIPPTGKKRFVVYNGSHPAWKIPSTTIMGLMNQSYFDSIIYLDGYNEFTSLFFEKNLWAPSEYVYSIASEAPLTYGGLISLSRKALASAYSNSPLVKELRLINVLLKILIQESQALKIHYVPYGIGNSVTNLSREYLNHVQKALTYKNAIVFFQPTALTGKRLSAEELRGCEYLCQKDYMTLYAEYSSLVDKKASELKLKNFYNLTSIFKNVSTNIYFDAVHVRNGALDSGMQILATQIASNMSNSLGLKKK